MLRAKRIVIKIGTSILLDRYKRVSIDMIRNIARQVKTLNDMKREVIIVSSGAIACGMETLNLKKKPKEIEKRQALASVGQVLLMKMYMDAFAWEKMRVGQVLLTHEDIKSKDRCLNLMNTLNSLLSMDIIPIINENDALSFTEIKFGDNDNLSALIAQITDADLLLLLCDVDGLYDKDPTKHPDARLIRLIEKIDESVEKLAEGTKSEKSVGGMVSKIEAAKKAGYYGIPTRVIRGDIENIIVRVIKGEEPGTLFLPSKKISRRQWWAAFAYKTKGTVWVDEGAEAAISNHGKSLLPSGITKTEGDFRRGECIEVNNNKGTVIARGIANYSSTDVNKIKGLKSVDIAKKLGYKYTEEIIHRDNMVII